MVDPALDESDVLAAYVAAAAARAGLLFDGEQLASVIGHSRVLADLFAQFRDLPLDDPADPAALLRL